MIPLNRRIWYTVYDIPYIESNGPKVCRWGIFYPELVTRPTVRTLGQPKVGPKIDPKGLRQRQITWTPTWPICGVKNGSFWDKHHVNSLCQLSVRSFGHFADLVLFIDNVALDFDRFQGITSWTIICIDIWFIGKSQIFLMSYPVKFWSNIYSNTPSNVHFSNLCTAAVNINNR